MVDLTVAELSTTAESGPYVIPPSLIRRYTNIHGHHLAAIQVLIYIIDE